MDKKDLPNNMLVLECHEPVGKQCDGFKHPCKCHQFKTPCQTCRQYDKELSFSGNDENDNQA